MARIVTTIIGAAIADATERLRAAGSPTPRLDAELLLGHALGRDRSWLLAHPEGTVDRETFDVMIERRAAGEPVAYIRGFKEWHSLRIRTDARALIPRPETELLADAAIDEIVTRLAAAVPEVREVGTGSGAIAVLLALRFGRSVHLVATDISTDALALAADNIDAHGNGATVELRQADLLDGPERPDVVIANLPYVSSAEVDERFGSLAFEPRIALDGGPEGLDVFRRLLAGAPDRVAPGATVLLEIGAGQAEAVAAMAPAGASVRVMQDLAGLDRVVRIEMPRLAG